MKNILIIILIAMSSALSNAQTNFHLFKMPNLDGDSIDFSTFKGKKVLVVNTASKCGLTPQYEALEKLYQEFGKDKFVVIAFPANNFLQQEPGSNSEIKEFCKKNYGVSFPVMAKIAVKGDDIHPLYQWLTQKSKNGLWDAPVAWNFQKFLIDENGNLIGYLPPKEKPDSPKIIEWIKTGKYTQ